MSPANLRKLAARLEAKGAHDLAREARNRASEREAPEDADRFGLLVPLDPGGGLHRSSANAAMHVQATYNGSHE